MKRTCLAIVAALELNACAPTAQEQPGSTLPLTLTCTTSGSPTYCNEPGQPPFTCTTSGSQTICNGPGHDFTCRTSGNRTSCVGPERTYACTTTGNQTYCH
jgi:hypothetical protein